MLYSKVFAISEKDKIINLIFTVKKSKEYIIEKVHVGKSYFFL